MPQPERYEMLVLGSGEGGKFLAWHIAKAGPRALAVGKLCIDSRKKLDAKVGTL
jgi:pyruvate/2-oxoglutarate dehydrogenase complex dihydrolipoamide dehydrogenase (E3) component